MIGVDDGIAIARNPYYYSFAWFTNDDLYGINIHLTAPFLARCFPRDEAGMLNDPELLVDLGDVS